MTININNATYGQHPYFDISQANFTPPGEGYIAPGQNTPPSSDQNFAIKYGSNLGNKRNQECLRRYIYQYNTQGNTFVYYSTHKGVRNFGPIASVIDLAELNTRSAEHATQLIGATTPSFITNNLLHSLFSFPSNGDFFFVEGAHYTWVMGGRDNSASQQPNFFKIYRYGKMQNGQIVICKNNPNLIERRD
jgi:hypothetical protein